MPVEVLARGEPLSNLVRGDTWVGATAMSFVPADRDPSLQVRLYFASDPDENDWVGIATCQVIRAF